MLARSVFITTSLCTTIFASSIYVPMDSNINDEINEMAVLSNMPITKMPYSLDMVNAYNQKIKDKDKVLFEKIDKYISTNLKDNIVKEKLEAKISINSGEVYIPNSHGVSIDSKYELNGQVFYNINDLLKISIEGSLYEENDTSKIMTNNSYLAFGKDWMQIDAGYRDHYYGAFRNGAMQISNNAKNSPSITISNSRPFEFAKINYEFFYSKLAQTDGISYNGGTYAGKPSLIGMHFDFHPIEKLEISFDRTFQFGGGPRPDGINTFFDGLFNPEIDNTTNVCNSDCEPGNQQGSLNATLNTEIFRKPVSIYSVYGGEDSAGGTSFSRNVLGGGIFVPTFSDAISMRYEYLKIQSAWYVHHIYANGYRNDGVVMGNWFGDLTDNGNSPGGILQYLEINNKFYENHFKTKLRYFNPSSEGASRDYKTYMSAEFEIYKHSNKFDQKIGLIIGKDTFGESFSRFSYGVLF